MRATKVSANSETNRMFKSDFFEFFSHIHPWQPPAIYLPMIAYLLYRGAALGLPWATFLAMLVVGGALWMLTEYWLHRLAFHYDAQSRWGKKVVWFFHGVHHDWPNDKLRLVFPPAISLPMAAIFWGIFSWAAGDFLRFPLMVGFVTGYLSYDMIHYWVHHFSPRSRLGKTLRKHHLAHHFKYPTSGFGVSTPVLDYVFRTTHPK